MRRGSRPIETAAHRGAVGGRPLLLGAAASILLGGSVFASHLVFDDAVAADASAADDPRPSIAVDPVGNSLIIVGSKREVDRLGELARQAQSMVPPEDSRVYAIRLGEQGDANRLRDLVQQTLRTMSGRGGPGAIARRVTIVSDPAARSLVVAARPGDFEVVAELIGVFAEAPAAERVAVRSYPLENTTAERAAAGLRELLAAQRAAVGGGGPVSIALEAAGDLPAIDATFRPDRVRAIADAAGNSLVVLAPEEAIPFVDRFVSATDRLPPPERAGLRVFSLAHARAEQAEPLLRRVLESRFRDQRRRDPSATQPEVVADRRNNAIVVSASQPQLAEVAELLESIDSPEGGGLLALDAVEVFPVRFADANELAGTINRFLGERAAAAGESRPEATLVASRSANAVLVAATEPGLEAVKALLAKMDLPESGDRVSEIIRVRRGDVFEIMMVLQEQFSRRGGGGSAGVVVSSDWHTNSIVVNAPIPLMPQIRGLVEALDSMPPSDETVVRTYRLETARADEAVRLLSETLQLDGQGRAEGVSIRLEGAESPVEVRARIVADRRSNSLFVTATPESVPVIEELVRRIDEAPASSPLEFRIVPLEHALAFDVSFTLRQMLRAADPGQAPPAIDYDRNENRLIVGAAADQFPRIEALIAQLDQPRARTRETDFVALRFADATKARDALSYFYGPFADRAERPSQRGVSIVADPATNSLVISAEASEWPGIRELIEKLDSEEYDASLQLRVFSLAHADARGVARAINEAFRGRIEEQRRQAPPNRGPANDRGDRSDRGEMAAPTTLVPAEEWVSVAAEENTNAVIVSASRVNLTRIERIIEQLDTAEFGRLPAPRIIPVERGDAEGLAAAIVEAYGLGGGDRGDRVVRVVGDPASSAIIVRAGDEDFAQIKALAEALQQQAEAKGLSVHLLRLAAAPAGRVADALREAFALRAREAGLPLSIGVDAATNTLVVASTGPLFGEIRTAAEAMDSLSPAAGQAILIIDLAHGDPAAVKALIEQVGLDKPQAAASPGRIVGEPIKVSLLPGRRSLLVVASPADRETVIEFVRAVDAAPPLPESRMRVVPLRLASAEAVATILRQLVDPAAGGPASPLLRAAREQIRRLAVRRDGAGEPDLGIDLAVPVRILVDASLNAVLIDSSPENVAALESLAAMLDRLPLTEAVAVQILPLENIAASQFARIVRELFSQGQRLGAIAGTTRTGLPAGTAGRALLEAVAIAIDERTNTVIVAGKEDAVALVEVLRQRVDGDVNLGWVEPRVIALQHADAVRLAETLEAVLVSGREDLPESVALRQQVGRLRVAIDAASGARREVEGDIFRPMTSLLIRPEPASNALVAVGSPGNLEVLAALVRMLDVEAAAPGALVRIFTVEHASATRIAATLSQLFEQQFAAGQLRAEDRLRAIPDERTNSLVVSTSVRGFGLAEPLIKTLDAEVPADLREIRMVSLSNAAASRVAPLLQRMLDARLERLRRVQPETAELERSLVLADERSNALVVAAGNDTFETIRRLAADLDAAPPADGSLVEAVAVRGGDLARVAGMIDRVMERRYADLPPELGRRQRPLVLTDGRTGSLLVAANPEDLAAITELVARLEEMPMNPALGLAVVTLERGRAETLAPRLQQLMQERARSLGDAESPADRVTVIAEPSSNSLVVAASDANVGTIRELVRLIGDAEGSAGELPVEVIMLTRSRAADLVGTIRSMYVDEENRRRGGNAVRVSGDDRLNAIVAAGEPQDLAAIRGLVARLDETPPGRVVEIRYIPLASANAVEMVGLVDTVLSGGGLGGRRGTAPATVVSYLRELEGGEGDEEYLVEISQSLRETISLTPDIRTNTVIVRAPRESMPLLERMIKDLDNSELGGQNIRVFRLANADADAMAKMLRDLFNLRQQGNLFVLRPREAMAEVEVAEGLGGGLSATELTMVPDERQALSITVDSRTNSLLVSGTPGYLDLVSKVVEELDAKEANERETFVYRLKNAAAGEVAAIVGRFVSEDQRKVVQTLGSDQLPSAARLLEREVTIVGDTKSNSVVVTASPRYAEQVRSIIEELDVDPPQVLIQVLLAEVTLDSSERIGLEFTRFSAGSVNVAGGFDAPRTGGGLPILTGLAPALFSSVGVPNIAVGSADFDLLINALQSQNRLQVLSNPSVMVANNSEGFIQVGQTVRLPDAVSFSAAGQQSAVTANEIGVILRVIPTINPDGYVRMEIEPEISRLSQRTIKISEDFATPIIDRRRANTTVTVKDGQTVVIGGLIQDRYEKLERKIPLLGDIPIVGALFRNTAEVMEKTELLIVLTPHVISNLGVNGGRDARADEATRLQIDKLNLPPELLEQIRRGELEGLTGEVDADGRRIDSIGAPSATRQQDLGFTQPQPGTRLIEDAATPPPAAASPSETADAPQ